jgi:PAS domain-containing protein
MTLVDNAIDPSAVLQAASESIIVTTSDLDQPGPTIIYANPAFERMTGWMAAEIVGKSPRILQGETPTARFSPECGRHSDAAIDGRARRSTIARMELNS